MATNEHAPARSPYAEALRQMDAFQAGWPNAETRERAFHDLGTIAARVIAWRCAIGAPPVDAAEVQAHVEDREAAGTIRWPESCAAVPAPSRYAVLRAACRFSYDRWVRERTDVVDAIRESSDEGAWEPTDAEVRGAVLHVVQPAATLHDARPLAGYTRAATLFAAGMWRRLTNGRAA